MQKYCEAPARCLQSKVYPYNLQYNGSFVEGLSEPKVETSSNSAAGVSYTPRNEGYYRPVHQQDYHAWSTFHPDMQKAQPNQFHGVENHIHPAHHEYYVPMNNRCQYMPLRMSSQFHPPQSQFQEFQYFVVIDFEATCDKERNPHPQEIIEFPSVLVNSATGQLEDYFQIYVRPTHNQLLSDFCKELTGIQQPQVRGVSSCLSFVVISA